VLIGSNLERRVVARRGFAGELDELERLNRLRNAVFSDVEVFGRKVGERHPVPAGDRHVDANEVDACPERGPLSEVLRRSGLGGSQTSGQRDQNGRNDDADAH
jgi:hypothetical protein